MKCPRSFELIANIITDFVQRATLLSPARTRENPSETNQKSLPR